MSQRTRRPSTRSGRPAKRRYRRFSLGNPTKRMTGALAFMIALMLVIGGRLLQLQGVDAAAYASTAESARIKQQVLPAQRGAIVDVHGTQLAYSIQTRTLFADPAIVNPEDRTDLASLISAKTGVAYADVLAALTAKGRYAIIAKDVDPTIADALSTGEINGHAIVGIGTERTQKRMYPAAGTAGQVVGFTNRDNEGMAGIEQSFDATLAGKDGKLVYEASPDGSVIPAGIQEETAATPGSTVQLTLDADIQYLVQHAVSAYQATNPGAAAVSVVALDAKTGQVVAMYGTPGYDPGQPGASKGEDLSNPAISSVLEPGSINKVTTFGPALDKGIVSPDSVLTVPGSLPVADVVVHDAWVHGNVDYTATGILAKSSNVGTLMVNEKLDKDYFFQMLQKFGEGQKTGIELPAESRGILAPRDKWSGSQVGNVPIGQGVSLTPLQMASVYQTIANDGVRIPPRIVKSVTGPDGVQTPGAAAAPIQVISAKAAADLRSMLEAVTGKGGTGKGAAIPGYRVGGKTGTGQRANPACSCYAGGGYYHTFVGMAPIEDPKYVISIAVTDPTASVGGGASPLFSTIMGQILQSRAVPPSTEAAPSYTLIAGE
ncbi:peptidoglycan D,D-transpeptidase FtsI family protein [Cumulibacter manganitolerans]|uniref:peptidoglycan D,D-transpeptidase FtsI family protein n=1 Tax=Cumulibacter manganitolerans TaxID=1884992 RepID=UPI0012979E29|nr:penicillin-binding protein 2 [Cumulibacter manganitolerans]